MVHDQVIPILDFGSQYAQLIARRVREKGVYSELTAPDITAEQVPAVVQLETTTGGVINRSTAPPDRGMRTG